MIQIENLDYKMLKKYVEEDVDNGYKNKGLQFKKKVWTTITCLLIIKTGGN